MPAWDPGANPRKFRCEGGEVHGWVYPDGTIEFPCKCTSLKRACKHTRHLYNPRTGEVFTIWPDKQACEGSGK